MQQISRCKLRAQAAIECHGLKIFAFVEQMTLSTKAFRQTAAPNTPGFPYGPYLQEIPENPINGKNTVQVIPDGQAFPAQADDSHGWIYQPSSLTFHADCTGTDSNSRSYFEY